LPDAADSTFAGTVPVIPIVLPMGFADGYVEYMRLGFYKLTGLLAGPNEIA